MPTIAPDIEQSKLLLFEKNFYTTAQQKDTKLMNSPAISYMDIKGISNISRIGRTELVDVTGIRNPTKQYTQMANDNRKSVAYRYTKTYLLDNYDKVVNLICDPTSDLFKQLAAAKNRECDRVAIKAAVGNVIVGAPDSAGTVLTAAEDGVITIQATSGFGYSYVITPAIRNFKNNEIENEMLTLAISANEEEKLANDEKFINNRYTDARPVDTGNINKVSNISVVTFAGSDTGNVHIENPILPEIGGIRQNVVMAQDSIGFAVEVARLDVERSSVHVNSYEINIDVYFKAVRKEGARVQIITSTI